MPNTLITLSDESSLVTDFNQLLATKNSVLFVVLGDTPQHIDLATKAAAVAESWRLAVLVPKPGNLYPTIENLATASDLVKPAHYSPSTVYAIVITPDGIICSILTSADPNDIVPAFMLAETY